MQGLGIPFSALVSVIFGLMILSFPIGAYVVFNSNIESDINFDYPLTDFSFLPSGYEMSFSLELGDSFITIWIIFVVMFTIAMLGPKTNFLKTLSPIMLEGKHDSGSNYLVSIIKWFAILIIISGAIEFVQGNFGIVTIPPEPSNLLLQFYDVTLAPLTEEIGFRVLLIGIPLFAFYTHKLSIKHFFKSLWNPSRNLHILQTKKAIILIVLVGIFFGAAHIISGEPWSFGKFAQASASGIILGWVYFRYGFVSALLVHWATNYFIFSYAYLLADINETTIKNAFLHPLMNTLEILLLVTGALSVTILIVKYLYSKRETKLEI